MNNTVELPLAEPVFSTYHNQGGDGICMAGNLSIRNRYWNESVLLSCNRTFLSGYTTPEIRVENSGFNDNPHYEKIRFSFRYLEGCVCRLFRNLLDDGYYVYYNGLDDYYIEGKTWYKARHFYHDGCISGYNRKDKAFRITAYDSQWRYRTFWTPQKGMEAGRSSMAKQGRYGEICALKPKPEIVTFDPQCAMKNIRLYLDSDMESYPESGEGRVLGIAVHEYIGKYLKRLEDGSIPHDRMDRRVFRIIWEHKKVMHQRIKHLEAAFRLPQDISTQYAPLVAKADSMRMLYASYHMKEKPALLPSIGKKLRSLHLLENDLLHQLTERTEQA